MHTFRRRSLPCVESPFLIAGQWSSLSSPMPLRTQGEAETDLPADELFERAVVGLKATIFPELREAVEAGAESAVKENLHLKVLLKNCFDAPAPPEGTTGGGDGKWNVLRPQKFFETTKA